MGNYAKIQLSLTFLIIALLLISILVANIIGNVKDKRNKKDKK